MLENLEGYWLNDDEGARVLADVQYARRVCLYLPIASCICPCYSISGICLCPCYSISDTHIALSWCLK
eukprot:970114-Rhodomonas_salina.1